MVNACKWLFIGGMSIILLDSDECESCSDTTVHNSFPPGYWGGPAGAGAWGIRNGYGAKEGRRKFHDLKGDTKGSEPSEDFGVNPETGDVIDGNGESVGNLNDED